MPPSSTQCVPVRSPKPLPAKLAANTGSHVLPFGQTTVTPVRTACAPAPEMMVLCPTSTPATSVIAFSAPGVPSNGTPRSRARGFDCWAPIDAAINITELVIRSAVFTPSTETGVRVRYLSVGINWNTSIVSGESAAWRSSDDH